MVILLKVLVSLIYLSIFRTSIYIVCLVPVLLMLHSCRYFPLCNFCVNSAVKAPEHLAKDLHRVAPQNKFLLLTDQAFVFAFGKSTISNLRKRFYDVLADVLLGDVAVIIHEDLKQHHRVLTYFVENF